MQTAEVNFASIALNITPDSWIQIQISNFLQKGLLLSGQQPDGSRKMSSISGNYLGEIAALINLGLVDTEEGL